MDGSKCAASARHRAYSHSGARILDRLPPTRSSRQDAILAARVCCALRFVGDSFLCLACVSARNFSARPYRDGKACASTQSRHKGRHRIRTVPARPLERDTVLAAFDRWHTLVQKFPGPHPLYIVATEGGGIRAAYWTGIVLGGLQDANRNFANHLFAISGVSGGSLGAVVFDALIAENDGRSYQENAHEILSRDFLSPALAVMLYPDLVQRFLPVPIAYFDRARALELGWEKAWRDRMANDRFSRCFVDLWPADSQKWVPALFLNGTSVEKGNRIMTSNLRVTDSFFDVEDAAVKLSPDARATQAGCHIPLSTPAHMSARFTYMSPAGRFPDGTYIVDGGYFENSGATAALEIVTRINELCAFKHITDFHPKGIANC